MHGYALAYLYAVRVESRGGKFSRVLAIRRAMWMNDTVRSNRTIRRTNTHNKIF